MYNTAYDIFCYKCLVSACIDSKTTELRVPLFRTTSTSYLHLLSEQSTVRGAAWSLLTLFTKSSAFLKHTAFTYNTEKLACKRSLAIFIFYFCIETLASLEIEILKVKTVQRLGYRSTTDEFILRYHS